MIATHMFTQNLWCVNQVQENGEPALKRMGATKPKPEIVDYYIYLVKL